MTTRQPLFPLGQTVATPGALETLSTRGVAPLTLLRRHVTGDWGEIDPQDRGLNEQALCHGERIFSVYRLDPDGDETTVWVITEADRSSTCLLLPSEY